MLENISEASYDANESTDPLAYRIISTIETEPRAHPKFRPKQEYVLAFRPMPDAAIVRQPGHISSHLEFIGTQPDPVYPETLWSWFKYKRSPGSEVGITGEYFLCAKIQGKYLLRHQGLFDEYRREWRLDRQTSYKIAHSVTSEIIFNSNHPRSGSEDVTIQDAQNEELLPISNSAGLSPLDQHH